jgi:NAD(P)H-hydrate epimerase
MAEADRAALAHTSIDDLVARAGAAVAVRARRMLGGGYGKRVIVVAGKGHNGDDGRVAARLLGRSGAVVTVIDAANAPDPLPPADLVIDAAYGTGFRGTYAAPQPTARTPILAVDIPSGLNADTGIASSGTVLATETVTFQAYKPGLLLADGPRHAGVVHVADIGIAITPPSAYLVDDSDVAGCVPRRPSDSHKWKSALFICAGSPGMRGAPALCADAAVRSGAGMVRLGVPGGIGDRPVPVEIVEAVLPAVGFEEAVLAEIDRFRVLVMGPGIGRSEPTVASVRAIVDRAPIPLLLDADGIVALGPLAEAGPRLARRLAPTILTPHDGEYTALVGSPPGDDRTAAARSLARSTGAVVLLKGPTTVVADPDGEVRYVTAGSSVLATAGTGDVLSGVIGALVARGMAPLVAAAVGAHVHGLAAQRGYREGLVASDLPLLVAATLSELLA